MAANIWALPLETQMETAPFALPIEDSTMEFHSKVLIEWAPLALGQLGQPGLVLLPVELFTVIQAISHACTFFNLLTFTFRNLS